MEENLKIEELLEFVKDEIFKNTVHIEEYTDDGEYIVTEKRKDGQKHDRLVEIREILLTM